MTADELRRKVQSLHNAGGLYEIVALYVQMDNEPYTEPDCISGGAPVS